MKHLRVLVCILGLLAFPRFSGLADEKVAGVSAKRKANSWLLLKGKVGSLNLGAPASQVDHVFGGQLVRKVDLDLEGTPSPALEVYLSVNDKKADLSALVVELQNGKIYRVRVKSKRFSTVSGIRVGSTVGALREKHGDLKAVSGEGHTFLSVSSLGMSFQITDGDIPKESGSIPDSARVAEILAYDSE